jgi:CAAX protease family protein
MVSDPTKGEGMGEVGTASGAGNGVEKGLALGWKRLAFLWAELIAVFGLGPIVYLLFLNQPGLLFALLWLWAVVCLGVLLMNKGFDRRRLGWRGGEMRSVLVAFALLGGLLALAVVVWDKMNPETDILFNLVRRNTGLWLAIMIGYPIASVYPQEIIFRAFFFERYRPLFKRSWMIVAASATAFAWVHIIFGNPLAVALTLPGGVIFALRYLKTASTLVVSVEHAMYGCLIFTIGIGQYFYAG